MAEITRAKRKEESSEPEDSDFVENSELNDEVGITFVNRDDAKIIKKIVRQRKPKTIDISAVSQNRSTMLSTDEQIEMLKVIENYRLNLPEMKFKNKKNHLPEITSSNVNVQGRFWMDYNGKKVPRVKQKYQPVGLVDGT